MSESTAVGVRKVVEIPMAPPRRLVQPLRFRSFKTNPDRQVWERVMAPVDERLGAGWRVARVVVDWGQRVPGLMAGLERPVRELTRCEGECALVMDYGRPGKGTTVLEMVRD